MRRLLVLNCSEAKVEGTGPLPAIKRYDGPAFRVVRRFLREAQESVLDIGIYVLSAKYGLIPANREIECYDERMTPERAMALRETTSGQLEQALAKHRPIQVFLSLGRDYLHAIEGYEEFLPAGVEVVCSREPSGKKLTALKTWLYGATLPPTPQHRERQGQRTALPATTQRSVLIRGRVLQLSTQDALAQARRALVEVHGDSRAYRSWYAVVDGLQVSPKWWVSQLSGLPVSAFAADEARRVLDQLGIEVYYKDD